DPVDYPADRGDDDDDEEGSSEDDKDDDMDIEADVEEEHPAPADSVVVALTAADQALSAEETEPFESDESAATPPPYPAYRLTATISIPAPVPIPVWSDSEVIRLLAMSSPPPSPLSLCPIRSLGYRATMIRLRAEAASTSHSLLLPPPFILSLTRSDAPSSGTPLLLPISVSTSSPPLQLPSTSRREDRPEVTLPPRKRLGIALSLRYEVGESSSAAAARLAGGLRADYGFVATIDRQIMRDPERGWLWDHRIVGRDSGDFIGSTNRRAHAYTRHLMETEARLSREAWVRSTDASDLVRGDIMSLRTTVLGQMTEIRELHAADRRRQIVISEMLKADHRRSTEIIGLRTALQGHVTALQGQAQVTALQGQQGLAGGPTQPELPEEAGHNELLVNVLTPTFSSVNHYISKEQNELPVFPNGVKEWSLSFISATALLKIKR
nr:hypothetical protein [Tanacetum cinerariifolium]